ncbi:MAG: TIGR00159 family protein [Myxococcales bacterium]|nr:TIGR00159 family protein [Myxococcales bacterium]
MLESLTKVFADRTGWELARDVLDVAVVAYLIYRLLLIVRGTRAMQMGVGLGVILLLYLAAKSFGLVTLQSLLSYVLSSIILIVIVVFQNDIRRALIRVGGRAWFTRGRRQEQSRVIDEVVAAVTELARHRIGAIITFEQDANILEFTKSEGIQVGAVVTRELLVAMFYPESVNKLHDGAVIIRDLKIARAGVFFPMPDTKMADSSMGSRHRAALGITEETDAVVVVVSEERGTISFCFNGNIVPNIDATALRQTLVGLLEHKPARETAPISVATLAKGGGARAASDGRAEPRADGRAPDQREPISTPAPSSAPPTATPLPKPARIIARTEKARAEAARSASPEAGYARSLPMPRTTKSILPAQPPDSLAGTMGSDRPPISERAPLSDRPSFVPGSRPPPGMVPPAIDRDDPRLRADDDEPLRVDDTPSALKTPISGRVERGSEP